MKTAKWDQPVFAKLQMQWYIHHWTSTNLRSYGVRYICVTNIRKTYELCFSLVYRSMQRQRELRFLTDTVIRISKLTVKSNICAVLWTPNKVYPFFPCLVYITRKFFVFANKSSKYLHITHTHTHTHRTRKHLINSSYLPGQLPPKTLMTHGRRSRAVWGRVHSVITAAR